MLYWTQPCLLTLPPAKGGYPRAQVLPGANPNFDRAHWDAIKSHGGVARLVKLQRLRWIDGDGKTLTDLDAVAMTVEQLNAALTDNARSAAERQTVEREVVRRSRGDTLEHLNAEQAGAVVSNTTDVVRLKDWAKDSRTTVRKAITARLKQLET